MTANLTLDQHRAELKRIEAEREALRRVHGGALRNANRSLDLLNAGDGYGAAAALTAALNMVSDPGYAAYVQRDDALYEEAKVHFNALQAEKRKVKQARANERAAAATRAAMCNSCFTVHAGDCY